MPADNRNTSSVPQSPLLAAAMMLAVLSGVAGIANRAVEFAPQVGDVVAFDPAHPGPFESDARLTATRPLEGICVLDLAVVQRSGGSLVLEQRGNIGPDRLFRAHWAGLRTSTDRDDCGTEADLMLSRKDIRALASAAGGFAGDHRSGLLSR